jgi:hypothetical protein
MVQLEPNLSLTLKNLAPFGAVLSAEQQVRETDEERGSALLHPRAQHACTSMHGTWSKQRACGTLCDVHEPGCSWREEESSFCSLFQPHARRTPQAALDSSVAIKRVEAGLKSLTLWGRITTLNGKVRMASA